MIREELMPVEYQVHVTDDGYEVWREGARYDLVPYDLVRIWVDDDTFLEGYLDGLYAYETENLPPNFEG